MDSLPTREQLRTLLHAEYNRTFTGWDFSALAGRRVLIFPPLRADGTSPVAVRGVSTK